MNRILLLLGYILLLSAPVCGRGVGTRAVSDCDSLHTFRFVQGRDVLYADYQGNNHELKRLFAAVSSFRGPIADGKMRIYVDGHCTSGGSVHDNLWLAYVRSSRVKSELITRKGMKEEYFVTHNHAVCYPGEERDVVIVCLREPAGADTLSAARRNYGMYASRYPLLPPAVPSAPDNRPCPPPILFVPVGPAGHPGTVAGSGAENPRRMVFSLKTNLADWSGLTAEGRLGAFRPNLALELHFARRWSVMASAAYSDWKGGRDHRFWGVSGYSLEPRLWLKGDGRYRWFYLGVYGQSGDFDYRPSPAGDTDATGRSRTGRYRHAGLSAGVYVPLSRHWGIEAGERGGYLHSSAKAYDNEPPHAYYHHPASFVRWGLTGINLGLGYRF